jgi:hypothetical protein
MIMTSCFLLFQQLDLYHTIGSSYTYLNRHFLDFYDVNKTAFDKNDYLPLLYAILALWSLPLKLLGLTKEITNHSDILQISSIEIIWSKLLLVFFFFATAIMIHKAALVITGGAKDRAKLTACLFATAPIAVFAVFLFGQYDIIGLLFTVTGFYYYLRKDLTRFAWFFSLAISFKYFPLIIFIPLLLLAEKRFVQLAKLASISLLVSLAQVALYWGSPYFRETIFFHPLLKIHQATGSSLTPYFILIYAGICLYAFIKKPNSDDERYRLAVFVPIGVYGTMFATIVWNPQWLIIAIPFFSLSYLYIKNRVRAYIFDMVGMLSFVWIVVNNWAGNVDASMLTAGVFRDFFQLMPLHNSDLMGVSYVPFFNVIFYLYLFSPLLIVAFERFNQAAVNISGFDFLFFRARFILGISMFVIPSLFCALVSMSVAEKFNSQAFLAYLKQGLVLYDPKEAVGEILGNRSIVQSFKAEHDKLAAVAIMFATSQRVNDVTVKIVLTTDNGIEVANHEIDGKKLKDNKFYGFRFPALIGSKGKRYCLKISSPNGTAGNAITAWMSASDINKDGFLMIGDDRMPGDLMIRLYYER